MKKPTINEQTSQKASKRSYNKNKTNIKKIIFWMVIAVLSFGIVSWTIEAWQSFVLALAVLSLSKTMIYLADYGREAR